MDKRGGGSKIIFPIILRLFERISRGEGAEMLRKKIKVFKKWRWGRISRFEVEKRILWLWGRI